MPILILTCSAGHRVEVLCPQDRADTPTACPMCRRLRAIALAALASIFPGAGSWRAVAKVAPALKTPKAAR